MSHRLAQLTQLALLAHLAACTDLPEVEPEPVISEFELQTPAVGDWLPDGPLQAKGLAKNVDAVSVQGDAAQLDDKAGVFNATTTLQRGLNVVEASAIQPDGDLMYDRHGVLAGSFTEPGSVMDDALRVRLNQTGLNKVMEMAENLIEAQDLATTVRDMGVLYSNDWSIVTINIELDAGDDAMQISDVVLSAGADDDQLTVDADMDVYLRLRTYGTYLWWLEYDGYIEVYDTHASATALVDVKATRGELEVDVALSEFTLDPFNYEVTLIPGDVLEYLTGDLLAGVIEDLLLEQAEILIPDLIDSVLAELPTELTVPVLDTEVTLGFAFADADIDADGLLLGLDVDVSASGATYPDGSGYLATEQALPELETTRDANGAVADEVLNALLYELWATGMLNLTLAEGDIEDPTFAAMLSQLLFDPLKEKLNTEDVSLAVSAALPPVVVGSGSDLRIQVGELNLTILTPGRDLGTTVTLAMMLELDASAGISDGGVELEVLSMQYSMMARDSDWGASEEAITNLLEKTIEELLGGPEELAVLVQAMLGIMMGDLPEIDIYGLSIESATLTHSDSVDASTLEIRLAVGEYVPAE